MDKLQNLVSQNPNDYWKMWKQLKTYTNTSNVDITISQFHEAFKHILCLHNYVENNKLCYNHDTNEANSYILNDILNEEITKYEIENAIRKAKNGKATGIDGLPLELILSNRLVFTPILECLFNSIFEPCSYPDPGWIG